MYVVLRVRMCACVRACNQRNKAAGKRNLTTVCAVCIHVLGVDWMHHTHRYDPPKGVLRLWCGRAITSLAVDIVG